MVFANKKQPKDINTYGSMRKDIIHNHEMEADMKKRYNIMFVVMVKGGNVKPVKCTIRLERSSSFVFLEFGKRLWER